MKVAEEEKEEDSNPPPVPGVPCRRPPRVDMLRRRLAPERRAGVAVPEAVARPQQAQRVHSAVASKRPPEFAATVVRLVEEAIGVDGTRSIMKKL